MTAGRICANQRMFLGPFSDSTFKEIIIRSVHMKRCSISYARAGETCSISFRFNKRKEIVDRAKIRKGMVCISDSNKDGTKVNIANLLTPIWAFTATILVLHHPTTINEGYQPVVHCGNIRQTATIMKMSKHRLRSGDSALIDMKFLCQPEFMHVNRAIIIREGNTKCIGKVIQLHHSSDYTPSVSNYKELQKRLGLFGMGLNDMPKSGSIPNKNEEKKNSDNNNNNNNNVAAGAGIAANGTKEEKTSEEKVKVSDSKQQAANGTDKRLENKESVMKSAATGEIVEKKNAQLNSSQNDKKVGKHKHQSSQQSAQNQLHSTQKGKKHKDHKKNAKEKGSQKNSK